MNTEFLAENSFPLLGGLMIQPNQVLNKASLRPLSGHEELWLARHPTMPSAARVTWLLNACLLSLDDHPANIDLVRRLLVADRDYLILQLRRLTLGEDVHAVITCPACHSKMDVSFRIDDVPMEARPQAASSYTFELSDRTVSFHLPTGGDQEAVMRIKTEDAVAELLRRCVSDEGGGQLSDDERETMIAQMEQLAPRLELELDLTCPECSHEFLAPFDSTAFFFDEMTLKGEQLLHEVHALAFYYHWSETEILGLERDRRRAYLELLNESLTSD
jgi:T4 bacteriophage base plate protein